MSVDIFVLWVLLTAGGAVALAISAMFLGAGVEYLFGQFDSRVKNAGYLYYERKVNDLARYFTGAEKLMLHDLATKGGFMEPWTIADKYRKGEYHERPRAARPVSEEVK